MVGGWFRNFLVMVDFVDNKLTFTKFALKIKNKRKQNKTQLLG